MKTNKNSGRLTPLETMLRWNRRSHDGDYILLNEDRTYVEAYANEEDAMRDILNRDELIRNEGFLVPVYDKNDKYKGMLWVSEEDIGKYIDLDLIKG